MATLPFDCTITKLAGEPTTTMPTPGPTLCPLRVTMPYVTKKDGLGHFVTVARVVPQPPSQPLQRESPIRYPGGLRLFLLGETMPCPPPEIAQHFLDRLKRVHEAGNRSGFFDAMCLCEDYGAAIPISLQPWMRQAGLEHMIGIGQHAGFKYEVEQRMIDEIRFTVVRLVRLEGEFYDGQFDRAAKLLKHTPAEGGTSAMRDSYYRHGNKLMEQDPETSYFSQYPSRLGLGHLVFHVILKRWSPDPHPTFPVHGNLEL